MNNKVSAEEGGQLQDVLPLDDIDEEDGGNKDKSKDGGDAIEEPKDDKESTTKRLSSHDRSKYVFVLVLALGTLVVGLCVGLIMGKDDETTTTTNMHSSQKETIDEVLEVLKNSDQFYSNMKIFDDAVELIEATPRQYVDMPSIGETLSYREYNVGEPHVLVSLPGYMGDDTASAIFAVLPEFQDHHIIAINPIGWYGSTNMNTPIVDHSHHAEVIMRLLEEIVPEDDVAMMMAIGYSTGGGIAAQLALMYPERFSHAFLFHSIPLDGLWLMADGMGGTMKLTSIEQIEAVTHGLNSDDPVVISEMFKSGFVTPELYPPEDHKIVELMMESAQGFNATYEAMVANANFNVCPIKTPLSEPSMALSNISSKIVVIHGSKDFVCLADQVEHLTKLAIAESWAPNPGMISYYDDGEGHMVLIEKPNVAGKIYRKAFEEQVLELGNDE